MVEEGKQEVACRHSCRPLKFRIGDREESGDRISELPDAVLLHILSFLSVDDAVLTSLLCRRWRNLWRWMDCLDFPMPCGNLKRNSVHFIGKALALHEGLKIKRFCARFYYNSKYSSNVDSWVHFVAARNVEKLVLDLFCVENIAQPYVLPSCLYTFGSLRELELNLCHLRPPRSFCLPYLKKLVIANSVFVGETLRDFISGCPVIEELVLVNCNQARDLEVVVLNQNLKRMKIVEYPDEVEEATEVKIYAPHLLQLELHSGEPRTYHIKDVSSIVFACLEIRGMTTCLSINSSNQQNYHQMLESLMAGLHEVKALSLSSWCLQVLPPHDAVHHCLPTPLHHLKHLKVDVQLDKDELPGIACLLRNSPNLERLTIQLFRQAHIDREVEAVGSLSACFSDCGGENFWNCQSVPFFCLKHNLKKVVVENFKGEDIEINLLKFLLKNACVLEDMLVYVPAKFFVGPAEAYLEYCSEDGRATKKYLNNIRRLLLSPRSPHAEIVFSGRHAICSF